MAGAPDANQVAEDTRLGNFIIDTLYKIQPCEESNALVELLFMEIFHQSRYWPEDINRNLVIRALKLRENLLVFDLRGSALHDAMKNHAKTKDDAASRTAREILFRNGYRRTPDGEYKQ